MLIAPIGIGVYRFVHEVLTSGRLRQVKALNSCLVCRFGPGLPHRPLRDESDLQDHSDVPAPL